MDLSPLLRLGELQELWIEFHWLTDAYYDAHIAVVRRMHSLRSLSFFISYDSDWTVGPIYALLNPPVSQLSLLENINLVRTITDEYLLALQPFRGSLGFVHYNPNCPDNEKPIVSLQDWSLLSHLKNDTELRLQSQEERNDDSDDSGSDDASVDTDFSILIDSRKLSPFLFQCTNLIKVEIRAFSFASTLDLRHMLESIPHLSALSFHKCSLKEVSFDAFYAAHQLKILQFSKCHLSPIKLRFLSRYLPTLARLCLVNTFDEDIDELTRSLLYLPSELFPNWSKHATTIDYVNE